MRILATNDDGIFAPGLWALVKELTNIAQVIVVAPDREQSAIGTAVTLHHPLRAREVKPPVAGVETYSVDGTPGDCVILALGKLVKGGIDLVVAGINQGANLGEDVLISGTVGAALQGYLRHFPALAVSVDALDGLHSETAARLAALLAEKIESSALPRDVFLNVNVPNLPLTEIKGVKVTRLAGESYTNAVEEGHDGRRKYYWLVRQETDNNQDEKTDVRAVKQGNISITPLHTRLFGKSQSSISNSLCSELLFELQKARRSE